MDNEQVDQQPRTMRIQDTAARFLNVPSRNVRVDLFQDKATGVESGKRRYGDVAGIVVQTMVGMVHQTAIQNLVALEAKIITGNPSVARVFYAVRDVAGKKPYVIGIRAVQTQDFLTATVSEVSWATLDKIAEEDIAKCPNVSTVYYDVTPKPPATIEME